MNATTEPRVWDALSTQVQHDTNLASQDMEGSAARLRRLARRLEDDKDPRAGTIREFIRQIDGLAVALKGTK